MQAFESENVQTSVGAGEAFETENPLDASSSPTPMSTASMIASNKGEMSEDEMSDLTFAFMVRNPPLSLRRRVRIAARIAARSLTSASFRPPT